MATNNFYQYRCITRIVIEAATPLAVGSGDKDIMTDALVVKDINGMPYIPGTSIAGVLRHSLNDNNTKDSPFGYQIGKIGTGSKVIISDAIMIGEKGIVLDGIQEIPDSPFYISYLNLPIRQHVCISSNGTTKKHGKFDNQVVFKGTRFVFEIELLSNTESKSYIEKLVRQLCKESIRFGSGTRNGLGKLFIEDCLIRSYDMTNSTDREAYLSKTSRLDDPFDGATPINIKTETDDEWEHYNISLHPKDFFLFSSGFGDNDADMTQVRESIICWINGCPHITSQKCLIPSTSIKGALAHRVAYHWYRKKKMFADTKPEIDWDNMPNEAVKTLFGDVSNDAEKDVSVISIGKVMIDDVFIDYEHEKIINHTAIDRFTGGSYNSALFTEKVIEMKDIDLPIIHIMVKKDALIDNDIKAAWEATINDLCNGMLPLGGGVNRGNGLFFGKSETI